jgi:hypothetical protein
MEENLVSGANVKGKAFSLRYSNGQLSFVVFEDHILIELYRGAMLMSSMKVNKSLMRVFLAAFIKGMEEF